MKYDVLIYNHNGKYPIGQVRANSILKLKYMARYYAVNFNGKGGRIMLEDQNSGRIWRINS